MNIFGENWNVKHLSLYLRTSYGREHVLIILRNVPKVLTVSASFKNTIKLQAFESQVCDCISLLNFLDDIPMIYWIYSYGYGKKEHNHFIRFCNLYLHTMVAFQRTIDHIIWISKYNMLPINIAKLSLSATCLSMNISIINFFKSFSKIRDLRKKQLKMGDANNNFKEVASLYREDILCPVIMDEYKENRMRKINRLLINETMTCVRITLQTIYFIHHLSDGFLWGGRLSAWQLGALNITSTLIHAFQTIEFGASATLSNRFEQ